MKALTAAEMREVDRLTTERLAIPSLQLMENAGQSVVDAYRKIGGWSGPNFVSRSVWVLCGKGNNGGDGFVVARLLHDYAKRFEKSRDGVSIRVILFAKPDELHGDAATNFKRWQELAGDTTCVADESSWAAVRTDVLRADVLFDAIFGTGFRGAVTGVIAQVISDINQTSRDATAAVPALIIAVDTPSGLPSDGQAAEGPVLKAHHSVTFTAPKIGQLVSRDSAALGAVHVTHIGSPGSLVDEVGKGLLRWSGPEEFSGLPLSRQPDGHKGLYGHVLVIAGSRGKSGAAVMAGHAALCAGAGLVTVATPDVVLPVVASAYPELMTEPLISTDAGTMSKRNLIDRPPMPDPNDRAAMDAYMKNTKFVLSRIMVQKDVLAIGPGLGDHRETRELIRSLVRRTDKPVILDADGLNAFVRHTDELTKRNSNFVAITPHPGEMARLLNVSTAAVQTDRVKTATEAAKNWNVYVVLKGSHTVLASPDGQVFVNTTGNAGLAKGGSGDTLTGILAACTGQFKTDDWLRVLALGVYLHGTAADIAVRGADSSGLLASEVAAAVPQARLELLREIRGIA